jgi:predicted membrane protein
MFHKSDEERHMRYRQWRAREQEQPKPAPRPSAAPGDPWWTRPEDPQPGDPWWLRHSAERRDRHGHYGRRGHPYKHEAHPKLFIAVFLICAGAVLFLNNIGVLAVRDVWAYWPLFFVAMGISRAASSRGITAKFSGVFLILLGIGLCADKVGFLFMSADVAWPILLIAFGAAFFAKTLDSHRQQHASGFVGSRGNPAQGPPDSSEHSLKEWVVFGNLKRRITTQDFRGGEVFSVFGEISIDLRHAQMTIPARQAVIEANATFGAVNIHVPEMWRVSVRGAGIFGGYEDKTIPPRPQPGMEPPLLIITGAAVFGGVVINN